MLKKTAAILLLLLLLFNFIGYKLLFYYAIKEADEQTAMILDQELYNEADLFTIAIPLSNPYQASQSEFERISGEIELKGKIYHYVKRKIADGNLILLCLPDKKKAPIKSAEQNFFKMVNDLGQNNDAAKQQAGKPNMLKGLYSEYEEIATHSITRNSLPLPAKYISIIESPALIPGISDSPEQPPESFLI